MPFTKNCARCGGKGYTIFDRSNVCETCSGHGVLNFSGNQEDYRGCARCGGKGYTIFDRSNVCETCSGLGLLAKQGKMADNSIEHKLHPAIESVSGKLFQDRHYKQAALEAYIRVIAEVSQRSGLTLDGDKLMNRAFGCDKQKPVIQFNALKTEADKDEQRGFMNLFKGMVGLRNTKAHTNRLVTDPHRAHDYLVLASLLMRVLEIGTVNKPSE